MNTLPSGSLPARELPGFLARFVSAHVLTSLAGERDMGLFDVGA